MPDRFVVYPEKIPARLFANRELELLKACGFNVGLTGRGSSGKIESGNCLTFYGKNIPLACLVGCELEFTEEERSRFVGINDPWVEVFVDVLVRARKAGEKVKSFVVEGIVSSFDLYGYVYFIAENETQFFTTTKWAEEMQEAQEK